MEFRIMILTLFSASDSSNLSTIADRLTIFTIPNNFAASCETYPA